VLPRIWELAPHCDEGVTHVVQALLPQLHTSFFRSTH
jgi:hypothetical protein